MGKKYYTGIGIIIILLLIFVIPKYFIGNETASGTEISGDITSETEISKDIEKIEVIHFHGTHQCSSCIAVGDLAEETINTYFPNELKSGKITFAHLNGELPENYDKVKKYGATGSSLWIGTYYTDGTFKKEENINVWYKINNKVDYMNYLKSTLEKKLGDN